MEREIKKEESLKGESNAFNIEDNTNSNIAIVDNAFVTKIISNVGYKLTINNIKKTNKLL